MLNIVCLFIPFPLDFEEPAALVECGVKMFVFMPVSFRVSLARLRWWLWLLVSVMWNLKERLLCFGRLSIVLFCLYNLEWFALGRFLVLVEICVV